MTLRASGLSQDPTKLVDARGLLDALFDEKSRPSLRWVRQMQVTGRIPYLKLGHLVRFDVAQVREHFARTVSVRPRSW